MGYIVSIFVRRVMRCHLLVASRRQVVTTTCLAPAYLVRISSPCADSERAQLPWSPGSPVGSSHPCTVLRRPRAAALLFWSLLLIAILFSFRPFVVSFSPPEFCCFVSFRWCHPWRWRSNSLRCAHSVASDRARPVLGWGRQIPSAILWWAAIILAMVGGGRRPSPSSSDEQTSPPLEALSPHSPPGSSAFSRRGHISVLRGWQVPASSGRGIVGSTRGRHDLERWLVGWENDDDRAPAGGEACP